MWNIFNKPKLLSENDEHFQSECYRWLLTHFGGESFYAKTTLILPTENYFPETVDSKIAAAEATFRAVLKHANMDAWPVQLLAQEDDLNTEMGETLIVQNISPSPHGTFSVDENNRVTITYNPKIVASPINMVATFAHELAHYLTATAPTPPPGGWEYWEFATDIAATFMGFGVFQANSAFSFQQFSDVGTMGWSSSRSGYLSEAEHSFSLAIFIRLKQIDENTVFRHCDKNIASLLKRALSELDKSRLIDVLKNVPYLPPSS